MSLSDFEQHIITFIDQQYHLTGEILSAEKAEKEFGIPVVSYANAMTNNEVIEALKERGVVFERLGDDWTAKSLTAEQLVLANQLLDTTDTRSDKKKLQDLHISTRKYSAWLKDPVFADYLHKRAEQILGDNRHEADLALLYKIKSGDVKAISYYNEMTGRFTPQRGTNTNIDIQNILVKIIEVIDIYVTDKDTKLAIAAELKRMIGARNVASALVGNEPIALPQSRLGEFDL